jgi:hypothetical protein
VCGVACCLVRQNTTQYTEPHTHAQPSQAAYLFDKHLIVVGILQWSCVSRAKASLRRRCWLTTFINGSASVRVPSCMYVATDAGRVCISFFVVVVVVFLHVHCVCLAWCCCSSSWSGGFSPSNGFSSSCSNYTHNGNMCSSPF